MITAYYTITDRLTDEDDPYCIDELIVLNTTYAGPYTAFANVCTDCDGINMDVTIYDDAQRKAKEFTVERAGELTFTELCGIISVHFAALCTNANERSVVKDRVFDACLQALNYPEFN